MTRPLAVLLVSLIALLGACGPNEDGESSAEATPMGNISATATTQPRPSPECDEKCQQLRITPTATATAPTPLRSAAPGYPATTHTGEADVDAIIAAVEAHDSAKLAALIRLTSFPCGPDRPVQPQVDRCPDGEPVGTMLTGVWVTHVEGGLWRVDESEMAQRILSSGDERNWKLHSVYSYARSGTHEEWMPETDYFITFAAFDPRIGPEFDNLRVVDGKIVGLHFAFGEPGAAWDKPADPGWLLPRAR